AADGNGSWRAGASECECVHATAAGHEAMSKSNRRLATGDRRPATGAFRIRTSPVAGLLSPVSCLLLLLSASASAGSIYSAADLRAPFSLGSGGSHAAPGPAFGARLGWEPRSWLTLGAFVYGSAHEATVPTPSSGELFQLYEVGADLRFTTRVGRV